MWQVKYTSSTILCPKTKEDSIHSLESSQQLTMLHTKTENVGCSKLFLGHGNDFGYVATAEVVDRWMSQVSAFTPLPT